MLKLEHNITKGYFKNADEDVYDTVRKRLDIYGLNVVNDAKVLCPVDEGYLRNSISYFLTTVNNEIAVEITVAANYAAFIEFGTRAYAAAYVSTLPKEWQELAAQYKAPGEGSFEEMVERLTRWVRLKGISGSYKFVFKQPKRIGKSKGQKATAKERKIAEDFSIAYLIALSILKKGIPAQPFLYPAVVNNKI